MEYSLVLTQCLNALGIPARKLRLLQDDYHFGMSRGHVATEAWIDDFGRWVVLDGQHGMYWTGEDGIPLGPVELHQRWRERRTPQVMKPGEPFAPDTLQYWFSCFGNIASNAAAWTAGSFVPVMQGSWVRDTPRLERDPARLYPDLSELSVGVELVDGELAIRMFSPHPFATEFTVDGTVCGPTWVLDATPGEHVVELAAQTRHGRLPGKSLCYQVR